MFSATRPDENKTMTTVVSTRTVVAANINMMPLVSYTTCLSWRTAFHLVLVLAIVVTYSRSALDFIKATSTHQRQRQQQQAQHEKNINRECDPTTPYTSTHSPSRPCHFSSSSSLSSSLFVYGTLMAPQVMQTLMGRLPNSYPARLVSPSLSNSSTTTNNDNTQSNIVYSYSYSRHVVKSQVFPALLVTTTTTTIASNKSIDDTITSTINGILYQDLTPNEWKILDWFEDKEYKRINVNVETSSSWSRASSNKTDASSSSLPAPTSNGSVVVLAQTYLWINPHSELDFERDDWNYQHFYKEKLDWYLEHTVRPCQREVERMGWYYNSS